MTQARAPSQDDDAFARATLRRVSVRILPLLFVLYICNLLDRTNVAMAALQMNRDLHFTSSAYGLGAGICFVGYAICEVPSNIILARVGASTWMAQVLVADKYLAYDRLDVLTN